MLNTLDFVFLSYRKKSPWTVKWHETNENEMMTSINSLTVSAESVVFFLQWLSILVDLNRRRHFRMKPAIFNPNASSVLSISSELNAFFRCDAIDCPVVIRLRCWTDVIISMNWRKMERRDLCLLCFDVVVNPRRWNCLRTSMIHLIVCKAPLKIFT